MFCISRVLAPMLFVQIIYIYLEKAGIKKQDFSALLKEVTEKLEG